MTTAPLAAILAAQSEPIRDALVAAALDAGELITESPMRDGMGNQYAHIAEALRAVA